MNMEFIKKNFILILAFSLPIILIIVVALSVYLPSLFLSTNYNFVYAACDDNYYSYRCDEYLNKSHSVIDGKIVTNIVDSNSSPTFDIDESYTIRLFLHDTTKNESREITSLEARSLALNELLTSPDGVTVLSQYERNSGSFLIFSGGSSSYNHYLTKGKIKAKLNLIKNTEKYYYRNNFQFIGWVLPEIN
jgi:hypothetical protein